MVFEGQEKMFKTSVNARPHSPLTSSFYRTRANIRTNLILPESRLPVKDLRRMHVYFSRNYFSKVARSEPAKPARKQNSTRNSRTRSLTFMHFRIIEKPTTDCVLLYRVAQKGTIFFVRLNFTKY